jgi:hypothetical protein
MMTKSMTIDMEMMDMVMTRIGDDDVCFITNWSATPTPVCYHLWCAPESPEDMGGTAPELQVLLMCREQAMPAQAPSDIIRPGRTKGTGV